MISFHLAIKDCRTLESFEEFASNGCRCEKGFHLGEYLLYVQFTVRVDIDAFAGHFFYYFIGEKWLSVHVRFHCRVAGNLVD